jgi:hypothetical protein
VAASVRRVEFLSTALAVDAIFARRCRGVLPAAPISRALWPISPTRG